MLILTTLTENLYALQYRNPICEKNSTARSDIDINEDIIPFQLSFIAFTPP